MGRDGERERDGLRRIDGRQRQIETGRRDRQT